MLQDHRRCPKTDIVLPHRIELSWPAAGLAGMTLRLNEIDVNPRDMPADLWSLLPAGQQVRHLDDDGRVTTAEACANR